LDERDAGLCSLDASTGSGTVDVTGDMGSDSRSDRAHDGGGATEELDSDEGLKCDDALGRCGTYEVVLRPDVTLSDVASFAPRVAPLIPEPAGIGVAGMPVNIVASASAHTADGELFDLPVTVRFRPVSFHFDYGDGTTRDAASGGQTWSSLGVPQFTPTATSHVYRERGTYTARVTVSFAAEVDFGTGWTPVPGLLAVPAGATSLRILEARTALVERDCLEDPGGIGC
jgi:hypothetical protein